MSDALPHPPHNNQQLFSDHYLNEMLPLLLPWLALEAPAQAVLARMAEIFAGFTPSTREAQVEEELIRPILKLLGHEYEVQPALKTPDGAKQPDYVFYRDKAAKDARKNQLLTDQLPEQGGYAVGDAKYWNRPLDRAIKTNDDKFFTNHNPSYQIAFYLQHSGVAWGILTNGKYWRLYHKDTAHKLDHFYEVDLEALLQAGDVQSFLYFYVFFRREAFIDSDLSLQALLRASVDRAQAIGASLKEQVYHALRHIAQGFLDYPPNRLTTDAASLTSIYDNSLILLYRLIFIFYAEARDLLPVGTNDFYRHRYGIHAIKQETVWGHDLLPDSYQYWSRLTYLFSAINDGKPPLEVATFNGGLFDPAKHPFLDQYKVGDAHLQQAIDMLARVDGQFIDYRDLSVRHIGTIYEGLLEYRLQPLETPEAGWTVALLNDAGERKSTGSYYTPDYIVKYIVEQTVRPMLERVSAGKKSDADKLTAVLSVNVLDPAMGSGHFLVEATEFIARYLVDLAITPVGKTPEEADLAYWKRRVVQSCIYGVDLNPLAVELAKLSLWLITVARDRPLSFLDHHLRPGNSLVGGRLEHLELGTLKKSNGKPKPADTTQQISLFDDSHFTQQVNLAVNNMWLIEENEARDVQAVKSQEKMYDELRRQFINKYARLLNLVTATQYGLEVDEKTLQALIEFIGKNSGFSTRQYEEMLQHADAIAARERFFHWEVEFPEIYFDRFGRPLGEEGGFAAVVGNPPWERIKLQDNEFFAERDQAIALAPRAADRKRLIAALPNANPTLWQDYLNARAQAEHLLTYVQRAGVYPLMGHGDTNLYAVFAEKALQLAQSVGRIGLLLPSGIATDDTTKPYFQHLVKQRMLAELLDFENREKMFPDVDSRFKFSMLLLSGKETPQASIRCGFFLHNMRDVSDEERISYLTADDIQLFNPNTLTCPIFRRRRDAELARKIYQHVPVLVKKSNAESGNPWHIRFSTMFHMTNDSRLFHTAAQLEAAGCWLGTGNIYTRGDEQFLPLYEGKMVQMYDHRAAGIVVNPLNLHRPAQEQPTTLAQHTDADFSPRPQFWVDKDEVDKRLSSDSAPQWLLGFKSVTAPTNLRSFISAPIPLYGVGNSMPIIRLHGNSTATSALIANLSMFVLDFAARQKIGGQNLNFFIVEQFPVLPPSAYTIAWQGVSLAEFINTRVLELCYTAHDLHGFAQDMGYDGPPFAWDEERRFHLRCQLDALYFHLYALTREEAAEIMETFPIVKRQDEAQYGRFRTKELILAYYHAYAAGNMGAWVKG
jgi:hypothetical protein